MRVLLTGGSNSFAKELLSSIAERKYEVNIENLAPYKNSRLWELLKEGSVDLFVNCAEISRKEEPDYVKIFTQNSFGVLNQLEMIRLYSPKTLYINIGHADMDNNYCYDASKIISHQLIGFYHENLKLKCHQQLLCGANDVAEFWKYVGTKTAL